MEYAMTINGTSGIVVAVNANNVTKSNVKITALNTVSSKYELIYHVCSDSSCTSFITKPSNINVMYSSRTTDVVSGEITSSGTKSIRIVSSNSSNSVYYLKLNINAGYSYNTLALQNMIMTEYSEEDLEVLTYVDGTLSNSFPTTNDYTGSVTCNNDAGNSSATGTVVWDGTKYVLSITNVDSNRTFCNVNFKSPQLLTSLILGKNNSNVSSPLTTPGKSTALSTESVLASTPDDYGTSYYYRGAVENNYLVYANMCWRIVRITGDGSIKITLFHRSTMDCTASSSMGAFSTTDGYQSAFNGNGWSNAFIGMYWNNPDATTYDEVHKNAIQGRMAETLSDWYVNILSKKSGFNENKMADVIWCNDKSISSGLGYGKDDTYYGGYARATSGNPSLVCPLDASGGKLSKLTAFDTNYGNGVLNHPIGLLTADEVVFAGNGHQKNNSSYYLYKNATFNYWWTMTPAYFTSDGNSADLFLVVEDSLQSNASAAITDYAVRPAVALKNSVRAFGTGIASDPYVIQ